MQIHRKTLASTSINLLVAALLGACVSSRAEAAVGQAMVEGGLDKNAIREVVRTNIDDVRSCYNAELVDDESVQGRVAVSFVIAPDGSVHEASIAESTMPERFDECLTAAVASWSFPAADDSTEVVYPFEMSPG